MPTTPTRRSARPGSSRGPTSPRPAPSRAAPPRAEDRSPPPPSVGRTFTPFPLWWGGWIALLLLAFGGPAFVARVMELPGEAGRLALLEGRTLSSGALDAVVQSRTRTVGWFPFAASANDLALVAMARAERARDADEARTHRAQAEWWQRRALGLSPADPYGWFRLAFLLHAEKGPGPASAQAFGLSLLAAPYEPRLMLSRLQMGIALYSWLDAGAKSHLPRLIRGAAIYDADGLARLAKAGAFTGMVEDALVGEEKALGYFRERLALEGAEDKQRK